MHSLPRRPSTVSLQPMRRLPAHHVASATVLAIASILTVLPGASRASDGHGAPVPAKAAAPATRTASVAPTADPLEHLRERLTEKLGASKPAAARAGSHVLEVASKAPGELKVVPHAAPRARKPSEAASHGAPPALRESASGVHATAAAHAPSGGHADGHGPEPHWSYQGETGPQAWGRLKPEFSACAIGKRQSPIDIRDGFPVQLDPVVFQYRPSGFSVIDNGHTVQANLPPGQSIEALGRRYELVQFHFHRPSEERVNGRSFEMVAHLVHKDPEGRLAVVAVLIERGNAHPVVQAVWNNLPLEKGEALPASVEIDLNHLLPADRRYYQYMGSLTTPPCSEGVLWMVMQQPVTLSPEQINLFARLYPMNARPVQSVAGRLIKQSN